MIITAQAEAEMVVDVRRQCEKHGIKHFWIDLRGANQTLMTDPKVITGLRKKLRELFIHLSNNKERAMLHCAAGVHRTGTMGYSLLRMNGDLGPDEAYKALGTMRIQTLNGVGDWRIELAEKYLV